jgi:hypothetical protein
MRPARSCSRLWVPFFEEGAIDAFDFSHSDELEGSVRLSLTAKGETFLDYVVQGHVEDMSPEDWCERHRSNLVDFVAESRFGWGQNRSSLTTTSSHAAECALICR